MPSRSISAAAATPTRSRPIRNVMRMSGVRHAVHRGAVDAAIRPRHAFLDTHGFTDLLPALRIEPDGVDAAAQVVDDVARLKVVGVRPTVDDHRSRSGRHLDHHDFRALHRSGSVPVATVNSTCRPPGSISGPCAISPSSTATSRRGQAFFRRHPPNPVASLAEEDATVSPAQTGRRLRGTQRPGPTPCRWHKCSSVRSADEKNTSSRSLGREGRLPGARVELRCLESGSSRFAGASRRLSAIRRGDIGRQLPVMRQGQRVRATAAVECLAARKREGVTVQLRPPASGTARRWWRSPAPTRRRYSRSREQSDAAETRICWRSEPSQPSAAARQHVQAERGCTRRLKPRLAGFLATPRTRIRASDADAADRARRARSSVRMAAMLSAAVPRVNAIRPVSISSRICADVEQSDRGIDGLAREPAPATCPESSHHQSRLRRGRESVFRRPSSPFPRELRDAEVENLHAAVGQS